LDNEGSPVEFSQVIGARHSVRDFTDTPVDHDVLQRVLDAASLAPSALNEQPWRFYVAEGETRATVGQVMAQSTVYLADYMEILGPDRYEEACRWYTDLGGAPIVVGITMPRTEDVPTLIQRCISIGAATQNLLLAVTDEGLAACMVTFSYWVRDELGEAFGLEDDRVVVGLVVIGHPGATVEPPQHSHDVAVFRE
jgi:nitroreductase